MIKYTTEPYYAYIVEALEEGIEKGDVFGVLRDRNPEVSILLFNEPLKNLPLYVGGDYKAVVAWRLKRGV